MNLDDDIPSGRAVGGRARMAKLTPEERKLNARAAALARADLNKQLTLVSSHWVRWSCSALCSMTVVASYPAAALPPRSG
jgi:hypothetical protein